MHNFRVGKIMVLVFCLNRQKFVLGGLLRNGDSTPSPTSQKSGKTIQSQRRLYLLMTIPGASLGRQCICSNLSAFSWYWDFAVESSDLCIILS